MDVKLIEQALRKPGKSKSGLARALGRHPTAVTNILNGTRQIKASELSVIAKYLELDGLDDPSSFAPVRIRPIIESSPSGPSALETIKGHADRIADLEQRVSELEEVMRAIGGLQAKKR